MPCDMTPMPDQVHHSHLQTHKTMEIQKQDTKEIVILYDHHLTLIKDGMCLTVKSYLKTRDSP